MTPTDGPNHRRRLAELMDDRRIELDLAWEEVARRAGISGMTLRRIRNDESALPRRTAAKIERAVEWQPGSVEGILAGGEPTPIQMAKPSLTKDQEALQRVYDGWERDYGPDKALRMLRAEVARLNAAREERPAG